MDDSFDIKSHDIKIYLFDRFNKPMMPLKSIVKGMEAKSELEQISQELGLNIIKV